MRNKDELKAIVAAMPPKERAKVERVAAKIRDIVNDNGHVGHVAVLWVGVEVLEQDDECEGGVH